MTFTKRCTTSPLHTPTERVASGSRYPRRFSSALLLTVGLAACGSDTPTTEVPQPTTTAVATTAPTTAASAEPVLPAVDFVVGTPAVPPDKTPTIAFKAPTKDQLIARATRSPTR